MRRGDRRGPDVTSEIAVGDVSGASLLTEVSSRITDEEDRKLFFAHVALGISLANLERQVETSRKELAARIDATLSTLRQDTELLDVLSGIRRAGRDEHFQAMIIRLGLQDWFCAYCMEFMIQPATGRPRKTCSNLCRHRLWRRRYPRSN
jgi:hypothetical protein